MNPPSPLLFALYRRSLRLYPSRLRLRYQDQILQTLRDAHAGRTQSAPRFWLYLFLDLFKSSIKERLLMVRRQIVTYPIFFHTLILGLILTLWGFFAAVTIQGALRKGADQPQIQIAQHYASEIAAGNLPAGLVSPGHIDPSTSLEPFAILYDADGTPLRSNGYIGNAVPKPPPGVFAYLRTHSIDRFTWQPRPDLRIAAVAMHIDGPHSAFILVGRSLILTQLQENLLRRGTFISWFFLMALLVAAAIFLNRIQAAAPKPSPAQG